MFDIQQNTSPLNGVLEELRRLEGLQVDGNDVWKPSEKNVPQQNAYASTATWLGYGGAAGGGKSDTLLGKAITKHSNAAIFRREYPQIKAIVDRAIDIVGHENGLNRNNGVYKYAPGKMIEFGAMQYEDDKRKWRGRPHDFYGFDEATEFTRSQVQYVTTWLRTTKAGQDKQIMLTFNPPDDADGEWVIDFFAPWLDEEFPNPAKDGEIRYAYVVENHDGSFTDEWVDSDDEVETPDGRKYYPQSRTFFRARVEDNAYLMETGYDKQLDSLPDALREMMRYGIIRRNIKDNPLQVIPREWIRLAQERWKKFDRSSLAVPLTSVGVDVSRGGKDKTVIVRRYANYYDYPVEHYGLDTSDGPKVAALVLKELNGEDAEINVDVIGVGSSVYDSLKAAHQKTNPLNSSERNPNARDKTGKLGFLNKRAMWLWYFMEALDPEHGEDLMLPDHPMLVKHLCSFRYKLSASGIQIESKQDIRDRLGFSPDLEAFVYAYATNRQKPFVYIAETIIN